MNWRDMNQFARLNAVRAVDGYRVVRLPNETAEQEFARNKAECIAALRNQIQQIECMGFADMYPKAKGGAA